MKIDFSYFIEKYNQMDVKIRYLIFGGILLLILLLDIFTFLGWQGMFLKQIDLDNQTIKQDIQSLKTDLQRIDQIKAGLQNSRSQLEAMNVKIRPIEDVPSILEEISRLASDSGIKIDQLTPQTDSQQVLIATGPLKYLALPIVIQASSGYHMFGHFLNQLETAKLFFTISSLVIENRGTDIRHHTISAVIKVVLSDKNTDGQKK
jgi:Tfp pilus assembly protein PilO